MEGEKNDERAEISRIFTSKMEDSKPDFLEETTFELPEGLKVRAVAKTVPDFGDGEQELKTVANKYRDTGFLDNGDVVGLTVEGRKTDYHSGRPSTEAFVLPFNSFVYLLKNQRVVKQDAIWMAGEICEKWNKKYGSAKMAGLRKEENLTVEYDWRKGTSGHPVFLSIVGNNWWFKEKNLSKHCQVTCGINDVHFQLRYTSEQFRESGGRSRKRADNRYLAKASLLLNLDQLMTFISEPSLGQMRKNILQRIGRESVKAHEDIAERTNAVRRRELEEMRLDEKEEERVRAKGETLERVTRASSPHPNKLRKQE